MWIVCEPAQELNFNALGAFYASGATVLRAVKSLIQGRPGSARSARANFEFSQASINLPQNGLCSSHAFIMLKYCKEAHFFLSA